MNQLLITTDTLKHDRLAPEFGGQSHGRKGYGGNWLSENVYAHCGALRRSRMGRVPIDHWSEDEEIEAYLGKSVNMFGRNQMGSQYSQCVFERTKEFARGEEVVTILRNGRMGRRTSIDVAGIRRRAESGTGSREANGASARIANGRRGEDLLKTIRQEMPLGDCAMGWMMPNARWSGISTNSPGRMI